MCSHVFGDVITPALPITVGAELDGKVVFCLGDHVWFVVDEYCYSDTTTAQACLRYISVDQLGIQWNLSNPDTFGTEESVPISEVS